MANKFKKVTKQGSARKRQDDTTLRTVLGLAAVAIVALIVFFVYDSGSSQPPSSQAPAQQSQDVAARQQAVQSAEQAAQANPGDFNSQVTLGNAYYDLAGAYRDAKDDANTSANFAKAVTAYQKALAIKFDIGAQTDMATAAFYSNQPDVADAGYKKAIAQQPDYWNARLNYGIFLENAKGDKAGAKEQFQYVVNNCKDSATVQKAQGLLQNVQ